MTPPRTILLSTPAWLEFCQRYPDAAQWLVLHLDLPIYQIASLTPSGEPAVLVIPGETHDHPGAG